jgi:hypothetical protein
MTTAGYKVVLLVEDEQGSVVAVPFSTIEAARAFEDQHEDMLVARGVARLISATQLLTTRRQIDI